MMTMRLKEEGGGVSDSSSSCWAEARWTGDGVLVGWHLKGGEGRDARMVMKKVESREDCIVAMFLGDTLSIVLRSNGTRSSNARNDAR